MTATVSAAARARANRLEEGKLDLLFVAMATFMVVVMIRPQDLIPVLGLTRPGLLATMFLWVALIRYGRIPHLDDPLLRCYLFFTGALVAGLVVVVNHNHWFWTVFAAANYVCAFLVAMPILLAHEKYRSRLFAIFLISFGIAAVYGITHGGRGQGDWLGDENDMAGALDLGFCVALSYGLAPGRRPFKWLSWGVALLCAMGVVVAGSRGGMLGFIAGALGVAYYSGKLARSLIVGAVLALAAFPFLPEETKSDFMSIGDKQDSTRQERIYSWKKGWEMFVRSPLLGVGPSNYPWRIGEMQNLNPEFGQPDYWRPLAGRVAHSSYVTVLSETGLLGTVPFAMILVIVLVRCRRTIYYDPDAEDWQRFVAFAAGSGLLAYGTAAVFISVTYAPPFFILAGLAVTLRPAARAAAAEPVKGRGGSRARRRPAQRRGLGSSAR